MIGLDLSATGVALVAGDTSCLFFSVGCVVVLRSKSTVHRMLLLQPCPGSIDRTRTRILLKSLMQTHPHTTSNCAHKATAAGLCPCATARSATRVEVVLSVESSSARCRCPLRLSALGLGGREMGWASAVPTAGREPWP